MKKQTTIELSEYDRKTRRSLLATSFFSILISALNISIQEPKIFGTTVNGLTHNSLAGAMILITTYYLAQYLYRFTTSKIVLDIESLGDMATAFDRKEYNEYMHKKEEQIENGLGDLGNWQHDDWPGQAEEYYLREREVYFKSIIHKKLKSLTYLVYIFDLILPTLVAVTAIAMLVSKNFVG